ncbi:MAG: adenylyl-sulfate kinase [Nocardioidaceae bacterium]
MPDPTAFPQHCPTPRELDDLELIAHGVFGREGFEGAHGLVTLQVPATTAAAVRESGHLRLIDPEGVPLADVTVTETYDAGELVGIQGPVTPLAHSEFGPFRGLHRSPAEVRTRYDADTVTVVVAAPLTSADLELIRSAAKGRPILLLALTGTGTPYAGLSAAGLIRATLAAARLLDAAGVVAVPLASRGDAESDHLLGQRVAAAYAPGEVVAVTGTGPLPDSVEATLPRSQEGLVVFFTGLSGSGKSTLARALVDVIVERGERTVTSLDGDVVRRNLSAGLTFSKQDRETNIRRIGWVAAEISRHGGVAICSPIAPFDRTRNEVRAMADDAGGAFVLVHVATPLEECERRDRKGLYAKARRGEIAEFTGISSPYEVPDDAAVVVDTTGRSVDEALGDVLDYLYDAGHLTDPETDDG